MSEPSSIAHSDTHREIGIAAIAVGFLAFAVVSCIGLNSMAFAYEKSDVFWKDIALATVVSLLVTLPLLAVAAIKIRTLTSLNRRLHSLAMRDELTGLLNRRAFTQKSEHRLSRQSGLFGESLSAFLLIDVDFFKSVNDDHGHTSGDRVLKGIAKALLDTVRSDDYVGRLGGEEFGIFLADVDEDIAERTAERVRRRVEEMILASDNGQVIRTSISIGCACVDQVSDFSTIYREADRHLYRAKAAGRNRVMMDTSIGTIATNPPILA